MKHRLFNRAFAALLSVMLVIGLMPVTALAAGGIELYVGGQQITESGCYENQNGTWTKVDGTEPARGQFYYDAATFTLTLNEAEISYDQTVTVGGGNMYYGSVIAFSQSTDVSLNIVLSQGTSTITGTGGLRVMSKAGNASLSISGPGSLEVKNVTKDSGIVLIGSKDVNLNIDHADVTISDVKDYGVHLFPGDGCKITATVNDGNLTAIGSTVGIYFSRFNNIKGSSSLTVSGNAMVDTEGGTGGIINGSPDNFQIGADSENGGIVFNGKNGTVYGKVELQDDLTINEGETLTIGENASLTVPEGTTLTNNGTITNNGTVTVAEGGTFTNQGSLACNHHTGGTATCTQKPKCSLCGKEYGEFLSHEYSTPLWEWRNDNTAIAIFECKQCDHQEIVTAIISSEVTKEATCDNKGIRTYTAKVNFNDMEYMDSKEVDIPILSCNTSKETNQSYDDGGPFTTDECGSVYDRWGNKIYDAGACSTAPDNGYQLVNTSDKTTN